MIRSASCIPLALALSVGLAVAQGARIALNTGDYDSSLPVEVTADQLSVDQSSGLAVFDGNVLVVQGDLRMSAGRVTVEYTTEETAQNTISRLIAEDGVTFVTPGEAAESADAVYSIEENSVVLTGEVLLTQGQNAISGEKLTLDLTAGTGQMEGRVRTVFGAGVDQ